MIRVVARSPDRDTPSTEGLYKNVKRLVYFQIGDLRLLPVTGSGDPATTENKETR